jgi:hypothetical protein
MIYKLHCKTCDDTAFVNGTEDEAVQPFIDRHANHLLDVNDMTYEVFAENIHAIDRKSVV